MLEEPVLNNYKEQVELAWANYEGNNLDDAMVICNELKEKYPNAIGPYKSFLRL
jgi:hypothetical protein